MRPDPMPPLWPRHHDRRPNFGSPLRTNRTSPEPAKLNKVPPERRRRFIFANGPSASQQTPRINPTGPPRRLRPIGIFILLVSLSAPTYSAQSQPDLGRSGSSPRKLLPHSRQNRSSNGFGTPSSSSKRRRLMERLFLSAVDSPLVLLLNQRF
jgi:hypothetical protein